MEASKILLISPDPRDRRELPSALAADDGPHVETALHAGEALKRLETSTADAVVCVVDSPEQVSCVVRMGKHRPEIPVLMLTSLEGEDVRELGMRMGAASVVTRSREPRQTAAVLREALRSRELSREARQEVGRTRTLVRDVRRLIHAHRRLLATAIGLSAGLLETEFSLLLVEDDRDQEALFLASLKRAGLPPFVRSFPSAEAALGYLKGEGRGPLPSPGLRPESPRPIRAGASPRAQGGPGAPRHALRSLHVVAESGGRRSRRRARRGDLPDQDGRRPAPRGLRPHGL